MNPLTSPKGETPMIEATALRHLIQELAVLDIKSHPDRRTISTPNQGLHLSTITLIGSLSGPWIRFWGPNL